jgi:uncharacterized membrane protein
MARIVVLISFVALLVLSASFLTSSATTAKPPVLACSCRLNGRIQCEKVRLVGYVVDKAHDLTDLIRSLSQALDDHR